MFIPTFGGAQPDMIPLPRDRYDAVTLADWLELRALTEPDGNASAADLISARTPAADPDEAVAAEPLVIEVFQELSSRSRACDGAYPFQVIDERVLQTCDDWRAFSPYVFSLCISYYGWRRTTGGGEAVDALFEELAAEAAGRYVGGQSLHFGAAKPFAEALRLLCERVGEGHPRPLPPRRRHSPNPKDDKVDVVAWRDFPDTQPGKLLLFGQCATGEHWAGKLRELSPEAFGKSWLLPQFSSAVLRGFFVPHRVRSERWETATLNGGILFDRCRIAWLLGDGEPAFAGDQRVLRWCVELCPDLLLDPAAA